MRFDLLLIKWLTDFLFVLVLIRPVLEPYRFYGFPPPIMRFLAWLEDFCRPVDRFIEGLRLPIPHANLWGWAVLIAAGRGILYLLLTQGATEYFLIGPIRDSFTQMSMLILTLLLFLCFLASIVRRERVWIYQNVPMEILDRVAGTVYRYVGKVIGYRDRWTMFAGAVLLLGLVQGLFWLMLSFRPYVMEVPLQAGQLYNNVLYAYIMLLLVRVLMSWFQAGMPVESRLHQLLLSATDPYLDFFRRTLPFLRFNTIDLTPIISIGLLFLLNGSIQAQLDKYKWAYVGKNPPMTVAAVVEVREDAEGEGGWKAHRIEQGILPVVKAGANGPCCQPHAILGVGLEAVSTTFCRTETLAKSLPPRKRGPMPHELLATVHPLD